MAEITADEKVKPIAFYLPQYHAIPENDREWGAGFTEWVNVKKAKPLFESHNQPRVPLNDNYYNLLDDSTKIWQSELAQKYGIFGFCYYHYWFKNGKRLLEKPAEQMLANKKVSIPFCFCWANENWARNWDGGYANVFVEQDYGNKDDWEQHFDYLLPFFKDERYITFKGMPVFLIYRPELIDNLEEMLSVFRNRAIKNGFPGLCIISQFPEWFFLPESDETLFDYQIEFEPLFSRYYSRFGGVQLRLKKPYMLLESVHKGLGELLLSAARGAYGLVKTAKSNTNHLTTLSYERTMQVALSLNDDSERLLRGIFCGWDNTPRKGVRGAVYEGSNPETFKKFFKKLLPIVSRRSPHVLFITAWNEWGEGAYLEPDKTYGLGYLKAIKEGLDEFESAK